MARETLLAAADTVVLSWASPAGGVYSGVEGDISWSDSRQKGFLRLRGLPANDPALTQYQLWIVDPQRADEPVDGGVFDVPAGVQELILPVQARLPVREPLAFALTLEKPGGVVVSSAPRLLIAQRG
jgi:anti-sigma-K factor RskA